MKIRIVTQERKKGNGGEKLARRRYAARVILRQEWEPNKKQLGFLESMKIAYNPVKTAAKVRWVNISNLSVGFQKTYTKFYYDFK